jgi:hypothetical protein
MVLRECFIEGSIPQLGTSWLAFVVLNTDNAYYNGIELTGCYIESGYTIYGIEALQPFPPFSHQNYYQGVIGAINDGYSGIPYGPNMANAFAVASGNNSPPVMMSSSSATYQDGINIDQAVSVGPIPTNPYQISLYNAGTLNTPVLTDILTWQSLLPFATGSFDITNTNSDDSPTVGPDFSKGQVMRFSSASNGSIGPYLVGYGTTPAVGDIIIVSLRMASAPGSGFDINNAATGLVQLVSLNTNVNFNLQGSEVYALSLDANPNNGTWTDSVAFFKVTDTDGNPATLALGFFVSAGNDILVDPDAVSVSYIPATAGLSEAQIWRLFRKYRMQVANTNTFGTNPNVPNGAAAMPSRTNLVWGVRGGIQIPQSYSTTTAPTPIVKFNAVYARPWTVKVVWMANQVGEPYPASPSVISSGEFFASGCFNRDETVTLSGIQNAVNWNVGAGGAAAATPITITTDIIDSTCIVSINGVAETATGVIWEALLLTLTGLEYYP